MTMTRLRAFKLGVKEFKLTITTDPGAEFIEDYDAGRELAHLRTNREFEPF